MRRSKFYHTEARINGSHFAKYILKWIFMNEKPLCLCLESCLTNFIYCLIKMIIHKQYQCVLKDTLTTTFVRIYCGPLVFSIYRLLTMLKLALYKESIFILHYHYHKSTIVNMICYDTCISNGWANCHPYKLTSHTVPFSVCFGVLGRRSHMGCHVSQQRNIQVQ